MHSMKILILVFGVLMSGCQGLISNEPVPESKVDTELSQSSIPVTSPEVGPGNPQKEFDQEVQEALKL